MLHQLSELSIWEISHYWHGIKPNSTNPKSLPIDVEGTLRTLAAASSKGIYYRSVPGSFYCHAFTDSQLAAQLVTHAYQRELKKAYKRRRYNKKFLDGLTISRVALAKWCIKTKTTFPDFWFPDDDPLRSKKIEEMDDISVLSGNGKYVLFPMNGNNYIRLSTSEGLDASSSDFEGMKLKAINEAISQMNKKNAHSKYQGLYAIKLNFIRFYHSRSFISKSEASLLFYRSMSAEEKQILVPSFETDWRGSDPNEQKATRTLVAALREYQNNQDAPWLKGFKL